MYGHELPTSDFNYPFTLVDAKFVYDYELPTGDRFIVLSPQQELPNWLAKANLIAYIL